MMYLIPIHNLVVAADSLLEAVSHVTNYFTKRGLDEELTFQILELTPYDDHIAFVKDKPDASQPQH